ncbi:hypothetical protein SMGD1_1449 [Sulfurimonas gotlandica GD1]|uniref:PepSY domain-containing protein n=1 Tax=Sulfurimonas gotlandica (strain DSM 19862 / JCM 16533 / GD1) TaxID=929558 RepID=B6BHH6_SULGG|nr:DUF6488 family protein [Sulfurimonas gotlandica]EDZ63843.1 conserved hypothetical protein [Sulfurimonas gotlandica GD1]EHP29973.1 hypothetical protein SMGD1_1449 [Sulfurimonas gotlandica GD1]
MKRLIKTALVTAFVASTSLFAGSGHSHGEHGHSHAHEQAAVSEADIKDIAKQKVNTLVKQKKIAKSWVNSPVDKMELAKVNYKKDWVVSFKNTKIAKENRQTLYVFVNRNGMVKGANYTGK